jgi:replicative DNA helicase
MTNAELLPPCDIEAEAAVISASVIDSSCLGRISFLRPEHFYSESHRRIFEAATDLARAGAPIDGVTLLTRLRETNRLEQVGGAGYLTEVLDASPSIHNVEAHAQIVHDRYRSRELVRLGERLAARARIEVDDPQRIADGAVMAAEKIAQEATKDRKVSNLELLKSVVAELAARGSHPTTGAADVRKRGIPYGIYGLDKATFGMHATDFITVAGLSGQGKTRFAVHLMVHVASLGILVVFFSVEMTRIQILMRMLAMVACVDGKRLVAGRLSEAEWSRVMANVEFVGGLPVEIVDRSDIHAGHISSVLSGIAARVRPGNPPLGLGIVDYMQALNAMPGRERDLPQNQHGASAKHLKGTAKRLNIPIVGLAQTKPSDDKTPCPPKPGKFSVNYGNEIIRWSDVAIYLWNRPMKGPGGKSVPDPTAMSLIIHKQRNGKDDGFEVEAVIDPPTGRFTDPNDPMRAASRDYVSNQTDDEDNELTRGLI